LAQKILIVDDDIDTLRLVGLMLERQGYEIAVATRGDQALMKAAAVRPDLILLDIMMPEMDGYEVTRSLRSHADLAGIPIIMFTAKSMVDDKVAGFEAGADDYITKPTHPVELTAHVKAVLSRSHPAQATSAPHAKIIGFLGARGGMGTTTLALNVGLTLQDRAQDVIIAELTPGRGTIALELHIPSPTGLATLLSNPVKDIHLRSVESQLLDHSSGVRLLPASHMPGEIRLGEATPQMEAIVKNLTTLCTVLVLDLGAGFGEHIRTIVDQCDLIVLVVDPLQPTIQMAESTMAALLSNGLDDERLGVALVSRMRTSLQIPWRDAMSAIGGKLMGIISPAPEHAPQAVQSGEPLVVIHPDSLIVDQIQKIADAIAKQVEIGPY
jgi:DNA-binding response OmpR family regulator